MIEDFAFGALGGLMIGCAAALLLLGNGRIMGASGILGGLVDGSSWGAWQQPALFVAGVVGAPAIAVYGLGWSGETNATLNPVLLILAGLCVGIGTRLANGCTSGHGVCGMSRLSPRGIVATLIYLAAGFVTVYLAKHVLGVL